MYFSKCNANYKIVYRWEIPATSGFYIEPRSGFVRRNATLYAYAHYKSDNAKTNHVQAIMKCESGSCVSLRLNIPRFVPKVKFVNDSANLGEIPLNLPTKVIAVLRNFEFNEMAYEVDSKSLIRGCDVNPLRGKVSPRGIVILEACFLYINKFKSIHVCMYIQDGLYFFCSLELIVLNNKKMRKIRKN